MAGRNSYMAGDRIADTRSGTPGACATEVKRVITWVAVEDAPKTEVRQYDRLFAVPQRGPTRLFRLR